MRDANGGAGADDAMKKRWYDEISKREEYDYGGRRCFHRLTDNNNCPRWLVSNISHYVMFMYTSQRGHDPPVSKPDHINSGEGNSVGRNPGQRRWKEIASEDRWLGLASVRRKKALGGTYRAVFYFTAWASQHWQSSEDESRRWRVQRVFLGYSQHEKQSSILKSGPYFQL